jgi:hypothetical protein
MLAEQQTPEQIERGSEAAPCRDERFVSTLHQVANSTPEANTRNRMRQLIKFYAGNNIFLLLFVSSAQRLSTTKGLHVANQRRARRCLTFVSNLMVLKFPFGPPRTTLAPLPSSGAAASAPPLTPQSSQTPTRRVWRNKSQPRQHSWQTSWSFSSQHNRLKST